MKRLLLLGLMGLFTLAVNIGTANAVPSFTWNVSGNYTEVCDTAASNCTNGATSTYSGTMYFNTDLGGPATTPPFDTLTFVGIQDGGTSAPTIDFKLFGGTCNTASAGTGFCNTAQGFTNFAATPSGTTFELMMCVAACGPAIERWILDVDAIGGKTTLVGFTGGTIVGGIELSGECNTNPPSSSFTCGVINGAPSATPLPGTLPLLGTGILGFWAYFRKRKSRPDGSFNKVAIS